MFYYLKGIVSRIFSNFIALDVGGAGYKIFITEPTANKLSLGDEATLYTYTNIKEDIFDIYGFITEDELSLFQKLISVNGVGPKAALSVLSALPPSQLLPAIISGDAKTIAKAPGVGSKTAQRIILELKGKIDNNDLLDAVTGTTQPEAGIVAEVTDALIALGYSPSDARHAASFVKKGSAQDMIKDALKVLMQSKF